MKRYVLNVPTLVALLLIPAVAFLRGILPSSSLNGEVTSNSVLFLMLGIYCFVVSILNLVYVSRLWKQNDAAWKRSMGLTYLYILIFALAMAFLMTFNEGFHPRYLFMGLVFGSLPFLCPTGIAMFIIGLCGLGNAKNRPKSYLFITFLISILFTVGGAFPALWVAAWWVGGGIQMCYCPVNRRSFKRDFVLRPLYAYRRKQLAKRLHI